MVMMRARHKYIAALRKAGAMVRQMRYLAFAQHGSARRNCDIGKTHCKKRLKGKGLKCISTRPA